MSFSISSAGNAAHSSSQLSGSPSRMTVYSTSSSSSRASFINRENDAERFQKMEKIGKGSFGSVYKGLDIDRQCLVAMKVIDLESASEEIEEIRQEIAVMSDCHSPYITQFIASYTVNAELYIVMEFLGGGSVRGLLETGVLNENEAVVIIRDLLKGIEYLHSSGKIHRDIKCANILMSEEGEVKVADFGVTGKVTATMQKRNTFVGTPYWMAPEVIEQNAYDSSADIWSIGISLYEMLTGEPPHHSLHPMKALFLIPKHPAPSLDTHPRVSKVCKEFLNLCLQKESKLRPTAKELSKHKWIKGATKGVAILKSLIQKRGGVKIIKEEREGEVSKEGNDEKEASEEKEDGTNEWEFTIKADSVNATVRAPLTFTTPNTTISAQGNRAHLLEQSNNTISSSLLTENFNTTQFQPPPIPATRPTLMDAFRRNSGSPLLSKPLPPPPPAPKLLSSTQPFPSLPPRNSSPTHPSTFLNLQTPPIPPARPLKPTWTENGTLKAESISTPNNPSFSPPPPPPPPVGPRPPSLPPALLISTSFSSAALSASVSSGTGPEEMLSDNDDDCITSGSGSSDEEAEESAIRQHTLKSHHSLLSSSSFSSLLSSSPSSSIHHLQPIINRQRSSSADALLQNSSVPAPINGGKLIQEICRKLKSKHKQRIISPSGNNNGAATGNENYLASLNELGGVFQSIEQQHPGLTTEFITVGLSQINKMRQKAKKKNTTPAVRVSTPQQSNNNGTSSTDSVHSSYVQLPSTRTPPPPLPPARMD